MAHKGTGRISFHKTVIRTWTYFFCADQFPFRSIQCLILLLQFWKAVLSVGTTCILYFPLLSAFCKMHQITFCNIFKLIPNRFRVSLGYCTEDVSDASAHATVSYSVRKANVCWSCFNRSVADTTYVPFVLNLTPFWACDDMAREGKKIPNCNVF